MSRTCSETTSAVASSSSSGTACDPIAAARAGIVVARPRDHLHAERARERRKLGRDAADADDAERLSAELDALHRLPLAAADRAILRRHRARDRKQQRETMLRDRAVRRARHVGDRDPARRRFATATSSTPVPEMQTIRRSGAAVENGFGNLVKAGRNCDDDFAVRMRSMRSSSFEGRSLKNERTARSLRRAIFGEDLNDAADVIGHDDLKLSVPLP